MRVFVEVVDCGSFTRAAHALGLSQATVSGHVAHLEEHIGARLLQRTTRSVRATDEGAAYYALCQRVLSEIEDAETRLAQNRSVARGRIRVDATVSVGARLIVPVLPEFLARQPDADVELHHTEHLFDTEHETFDVLFRVGEPKDSDLVARAISPMPLVLAASPAYLARRGEPKHPDALSTHDFIGYVDPMTGRSAGLVLERGGERVNPACRTRLSCNEGESRIAAAVAGLGVVLTHAYELRALLRDGVLKVVLSDWRAPPSRFYVAHPRDRYLSARVTAFIDFIVEKYPPGIDLA